MMMTPLRMLTVTMFVGLSVPATAQGIVGSKHDFSGATWNFRGEICRVCHVPHDHNYTFQRGANGMLWNHALSSATYTMYSSASIDNSIDTAPTGRSKLCLGCHDGTVGLDAFDSNADTGAGYTFINDPYRVPGSLYWTGSNGDLNSTHPISIVYDETVDTGLKPKTTTMGTSGPISAVLDTGNKVQCSTCHDVHRKVSVSGTPLLRAAMTTAQGGASALCLTCHDK